jgi:TonB-linked SusC/RagA family outer membrane protein
MKRLALLLLVLAVASPVRAQEMGTEPQHVALGGPRFLDGAGPGARPVEPTSVAALQRRVTLTAAAATLGDALRAITQQTGVRFLLSPNVVPVTKAVRVEATGLSLAAALTELLLNANVDVAVASPTELALVPRRGKAMAPGVIVGRVTDAKTEEALAGAEVFLEGTRARTTTGESGVYKLAGVEPGSYTLVARRVGYAKQSRPITVESDEEITADFALQPVPTQLNELVTTATGEQRRLELGHVVGRINADSLVKEAPISTLSELLTARVPGLQVFQTQGTVGGQVRLQVRGMNSFSLSNEPILIIDGMRYTSRAVQGLFSEGDGGVEPTSPLNDLNPNDIESIEVVKGPSAATLYGTDAANGVLVITTKRGKPGPARWSTFARGTLAEVPKSQYPGLYWGWNSQFPDFSCTLQFAALQACTQDSVTVLPNALNYPQHTLFDPQPSWEYGASVAGGREDLRYYFSGSFDEATGPLQMPPAIAQRLQAERGLSELPEEWRHPNALNKLNLRANVTATLGSTADLRVNTGYVHGTTRSIAGHNRSPYAQGAFARTPRDPYGNALGAATHPAEAFLETSTDRTDRFFGSAGGEWRPTSWLATRATVGLDLTSGNRYTLARRGDTPSSQEYPNGRVLDDRMRQLATTAELGATATGRRGRLSARTAVGAQYVRSLSDVLATYGSGLPPGGSSVGEAEQLFTRQTYGETVTLGSYLEETLGWNDRLFLTGALRVDGASALGRDYDAVAYPKVSASWLVSEEPFMPRLPGLDELRLRYAFGASGLQPRPEWARPNFRADHWAMDGGEYIPTVWLDALGDPGLRPERVREHEFGLDASGLTDRVRLGLTWYRRRTADQIVEVPPAPGMGEVFSRTNLGLTTQHGFEAELTARVLDTRLVSWDLILHHALHRTRLVDLGDGLASTAPGGVISQHGGWVEGYSLGARFHAPLLGYADANGDGVIGLDEVQVDLANPIYTGESVAPRSQTLTMVLGLFERRLRFSALLERRTGFTQVNQLTFNQCAQNTCRAVVDPSTPLAEQAEVAAAVWAGRLPEKADFTRLRELTAALDLPTGLARALRVSSASLALTARNVALWTDFSGPDPESAVPDPQNPVGGGAYAAGVPQGRSWTLRLDLGF